jgi:hypothetical protein
MKADSFITEIDVTWGTGHQIPLTYPAVCIREHDNSPVFYVIARVEFGESSEELFARARRVAEALTVDKPPKRKQVSVASRAAD